jgi:predicted metal-binding protein
MSLVSTPSAALAACGHCGSKRVTSLSMTLTDGSLVDFSSCHRCEGKTWSRAGSALGLTEVLDRARKHR